MLVSLGARGCMKWSVALNVVKWKCCEEMPVISHPAAFRQDKPPCLVWRHAKAVWKAVTTQYSDQVL